MNDIEHIDTILKVYFSTLDILIHNRDTNHMNKKNNYMKFFLLITTVLLISACNVKKQNIVQGRLIDPEFLEQIELGMSKEQVRVILGSPALIDAFYPNKWIYYHSKTRIDKNQPEEIGKLILDFDNSTLSNISGGENIVAEKTDANLTGNTIITEPTQKKRGIFNR